VLTKAGGVCCFIGGLKMSKYEMPYLWEDDWDNQIFKTAKERFGIWPLTVWPCDHQDPLYRRLKKEIGDTGQARRGCLSKPDPQSKSWYRGKHTESIFNPQLCVWILNCFAPQSGICFDPFAGGGTRAVLAAKHGLKYTGIELRHEEAERVKNLTEGLNIIEGDARDCLELVGHNFGDFLITCPPYWNLEQYKGGLQDLSMLETYDEFLAALRQVITGCFGVMNPGSLSCWVVGLHRNTDGELLAMNHDIARLHKEVGFKLREEIVVNHIGTQATMRVGNFEKGNRWLIRTHEYVLVFEKPEED